MRFGAWLRANYALTFVHFNLKKKLWLTIKTITIACSYIPDFVGVFLCPYYKKEGSVETPP